MLWVWETEQTKSFAVSWLKNILLYNYGAGNKTRWEMSYSRVSLFLLLAKSRILSFTRNIWRKMSFQVKFQFKIRQKCRSKWNDIGHTLELGVRKVVRNLGMFWDTEQTKSFAVSWLKSILLYNYGAGNKRRWEMSYSRVSLFSLLAKSRILSFTRNIWRKTSFQVKFQFKIMQKCRSKWNRHRTYFRTSNSTRVVLQWSPHSILVRS